MWRYFYNHIVLDTLVPRYQLHNLQGKEICFSISTFLGTMCTIDSVDSPRSTTPADLSVASMTTNLVWHLLFQANGSQNCTLVLIAKHGYRLSNWALKACLHIPILSPLLSSFIIVPMVTGYLTGRMGQEPILCVRQPVTINTM